MSIIKDEESFTSVRWIYTSAVMARRLGDVISKKCVGPGFFQKADIRSAKILFGALVEAAKTSCIDDGLAANIGLFDTTNKGKPRSRKKGIASKTSALRAFAEFVAGLDRPRRLDEQELAIASELRKLFLKIYEDGGATVYEQCVAGEFSG